MAASAGTAHGPWRRMAVVLAVCVLLLLDAAVCQDGTSTSQIPTSGNSSLYTSGNVTLTEGTTDSPNSSTTGYYQISSTSLNTHKTTQSPTGNQVATAGSASSSPAPTATSNQITLNTPGGSSTTIKGQEVTSVVPSTDKTILPTNELYSSLDGGSTILDTTDNMTGVGEKAQSNINLVESRPPEKIECVNKEAVKNQNAVFVTLEQQSSCTSTGAVLQNYVTDLCGQDCKLKIFQEDNSNTLIVAAENTGAAPGALAEILKNEDIKRQLGVMNAVPSWRKAPPTVLVSLLLVGLLLLALLLGGYCLKVHRGHSSKGMRLQAEESYHGDEENQGNTLVSVAPLKQPEPQEKPNINGESPDGGKNQPTSTGIGEATTNGHSAAKNPVADTEL